MKIKKGDTVQVIAGSEKGKSGKIIRVFPDANEVVIEGVNIRKKHQRSNRRNQQGQIIEKAMPVHASNVALLDPKENAPTRIGISREGGTRTRIAKKSGEKLA